MTIDYPYLSSILHFITWILVGFIILIMGAIGLFYEKKFQIKTNYYLFLIPAILILGEIFHLVVDENGFVEFIEMIGVLVAAILSIRLHQKMTGGG